MTEEENKYLVNAIKTKDALIVSEFFDLCVDRGAVEDFPREYIEHWLTRQLRELYNLYLCFFERKNLPLYVSRFKEQFDDIVKDDDAICGSYIDYEETTPDLTLIREWKSFVSGFIEFNKNEHQVNDFEKLIEVLKSTDYIVKNTIKTWIREADIYKQVLWVLRVYFKSATNGTKSPFLGTFKVYEPDIFILELGVAIEYKLIREKANIDDYIDQIKVDATNYKDDTRFKTFIAVIVLADSGVATIGNIKQCWRQKKFPDNWQLIISHDHEPIK